MNEEELQPNVSPQIDMTQLQQYFDIRGKTINELRKSKNPDPYPHKFQTTMSIPDFVEKYQHLARGELLQGTEVALAGRVMVKRDANKLKFYNLHGEVSLSYSYTYTRAPKFRSRLYFSML